MSKISVVVPIYNSEKYIERCVVSLFDQTLDDIEYIFIDDCSTDNSIQIINNVIKRYPHRSSNVIIHSMHVNRGVAKARIWGIKHASGDYIIHCDADDWVDNSLYELLYNKAIEDNADIAVCDYIIWKSSDNNQIVSCCKSSDAKKFFESIINQKESWSLWNKLIHRNICKNSSIINPTGIMGEDAVLVLQYAYLSRKISHCKGGYYYYFFNSESITKSSSEEKVYHKFKHSIMNAEQLIKFFNTNNLDNKYRKQIDKILFNKKNLLIPNLGKIYYYKIWKNTFSLINFRIIFNSEVPITERLRHILLLLGLRLNVNRIK